MSLPAEPRLPAHLASILPHYISNIDPDVPFRPTFKHRHATWAGTFHSRPELYLEPQSVEEVQKIIRLARVVRRRVVPVGCGHSPSDITCTSAWLVRLDRLNACEGVSRLEPGEGGHAYIKAQAGIRLRDLNQRAKEYGYTLPNLGSINDQSIAGALATGTHGSSLYHGTLASNVRSLRIVLGDGTVQRASATENEELFRAALVSLGALGIMVEIEYRVVPDRRIEWVQRSIPLSTVLETWDTDLWTQAEFTRVWWMPYTRRAIVWRANVTDKPLRKPQSSWYGGVLGYHAYKTLLTIGHFVPRILPWVEWFIFGMQYGFDDQTVASAVEHQRDGLLMDCLYSQFVNEWAMPLSNGPDAIRTLDAWFHREPQASPLTLTEPSDSPLSSSKHLDIPPIGIAPRGFYVHAPIEVRVTNNSATLQSYGSTSPASSPPTAPRALLDQSAASGPTLYLNATLYRPYGLDPPCHTHYYTVFERVCAALSGRPHWAKNFRTVTPQQLEGMYGADLATWRSVRERADPDGVFVGPWHRRSVLPLESGAERLPCEEEVLSVATRWGGGVEWKGVQLAAVADEGDGYGASGQTTPKAGSGSESSFEVWGRGEAVESAVLVEKDEDEL